MQNDTDESELEKLIAVTARLRAPGGCPWDADQTHASLVQYLIEECYELVDAIETGTPADLLEELGDVLYQVLFHADIAAHTLGEDFDIQSVAAQMTAKMVGRHPHVFGDRVAQTAEDVVGFWDDLKRTEKPHRTSTLDGVPQGMPALSLADKLIGKAQKTGVLPIEVAEVAGATDEDELGRTLLGIVVAAKAHGMDAERSLRSALRGLQAQIRAAEANRAQSGRKVGP
ncbi:MAG: MazG family protein [Sciscionella sp.]